MTKKDGFKIIFRGIRGSYPVADKNFLKYGGNTSCVEVIAGGKRIILDAGSGIIPLGDKIYKDYISSAENPQDRHPMDIILLLTHVHQDHIQGLNFFKPINVPSTKFSLYGYSGFDWGLDETLSELCFGKSFPINLYDITANIYISNISETDVITINKENELPVLKRVCDFEQIKPKKDEIVISMAKLNSHPNFGVMSYKITYNNKSVVYATDTECYFGGAKKLELFAKDANLLIHDSQYTTEDYLSAAAPKQGFGHSTFDMALQTAKSANVKQLAFFHFDPSYNDEKLTNIENSIKKNNANCFLAKEGLEICL